MELRLRRAWASLVGTDVARRARPDALAAGTLTVLVDNSPWLHELTLRTEAMRQRIAERFPEVRSLRFALGTLDGEPADDASPRRKPTPITDAERTEIDTVTAAIPDPTLAAAARRLMTTAWRFPVTRGPVTRG